ncbi:hypothetical protein C2S52_013580 [Perilla frutescens var. hirtella]|nr:hypothetical protein C2S52_013580 [Perilla frutescens var. hirtella]
MGFSHHRSLQYYVLQLFLLIFSCVFIFAAAIDTIKANESLSDYEALISSGKRFKLSFFSPPNSNRRYVVIMFNLPVITVVWVANRNKPLNDSTGTLEISSDGNLVILDGRKEMVCSTNLSTSAANANSSAVLLDTADLVLKDSSSNTYWESFKHASDSWLENMKILTDLSRNEKNILTSWKSGDDPTPGSFTLSIEPSDFPQLVVWKEGYTYLRSGPWNGQRFPGLPNLQSYNFTIGASVVRDSPGVAYATFTLSIWSVIPSECDMYNKCGPFGSCNTQDNPICSCFHGFMPTNRDEWEAGNWTTGCTRRTRLQCEQNNSMAMGGEQDEFLKVKRVKMPDHYKWLPSLGDCRDTCLSNCSCRAYANPSGVGCLHWTRNLIDAQLFNTYGGDDLYIRLAFSELQHKKNDRRIIIATTVVLGFILAAVCAYFLTKFLFNYRARKHKNILISSETKGTDAEYSEESRLKHDKHEVKLEEVPLFKFETISNATKNFDPVNKLGQGGFGAVYKISGVTASSNKSLGKRSVNDVTISAVEGR